MSWLRLGRERPRSTLGKWSGSAPVLLRTAPFVVLGDLQRYDELLEHFFSVYFHNSKKLLLVVVVFIPFSLIHIYFL